MTTEEKIIYVAGFFDGEGSIAITRNKAKSSAHGYMQAAKRLVY